MAAFVFHAQHLRDLGVLCGCALSISGQLLVLRHLRPQHGGERSPLRLRPFGLFLCVPQLSIEQINLLLHDLVPFLQRDDHRLLLGRLFAQLFVLRLKRGFVRLAAGGYEGRADQ